MNSLEISLEFAKPSLLIIQKYCNEQKILEMVSDGSTQKNLSIIHTTTFQQLTKFKSALYTVHTHYLSWKRIFEGPVGILRCRQLRFPMFFLYLFNTSDQSNSVLYLRHYQQTCVAKTCCISADINECEGPNNGGCGEDLCQNTAGSYACVCGEGYGWDAAKQLCLREHQYQM